VLAPSAPRIALVSPVRDEEALLPGLIASMASQTVRPSIWVIVDDGSKDRTPEIASAAAAEHPWIRVVRRSGGQGRRLGGGVVDAFNEGLAHVPFACDFLGKVDADLTFGPRYLEAAIEQFASDPGLGSVSGKVFRPEGSGEVEEFMIDEVVAGQWKLWSRACFEAIGGLVPAVMWDGIDFHMARQKGFRTRSLDDPRMRILHHRLMGSSDRSVHRGRMRWGRGQWFMGSHPLYVLASAVFRMREKPRVVGGFLIWWGWFCAMIRREPRLERPGFRSELRRWQMRRLFSLLRRRTAR
jgi:glycosyltransferase involved in cell wall biosynthesis